MNQGVENVHGDVPPEEREIESVQLIDDDDGVNHEAIPTKIVDLGTSHDEFMEQIDDTDGIPEFTVEELMNKCGFGLFHVFLTLYTGSYFMMEAAEVIMLSLLLPFLKEKMDLTNLQESLIGAVVFTGMGIGSYTFGYVSDRLGRRFAITVSVVFCTIFGVSSAFCANFYLFICVRFFVGFACGGAPVPFSLYVEYLPSNLRGVLVLNQNLFWSFGAIYESIIGWIILTNDSKLNGYGWNWYVLCSSFPLIINLLLLPFTPESIRYLSMSKTSKEEEIKKIFAMIARMNCKKIPKNYRLKLKSNFSKRRGNIMDLFKKQTFFMFLCICVYFMSGSFVYYGVALSTPDLIQSKESYSRYLGTLLLSISEIVGLVIPSVLFSCFSRQVTQSFSFLCTGLALLMLLIPVENFGYKLVFGLIARMGIMSASCIMWVISSESLPTNIRSVGSGIGNGLGKICTIIAPFFSFLFGGIGDNLIPKVVFASVSLVAAFVSTLFPYEARGKGLADIREEVELKDMKFMKKMNVKNEEISDPKNHNNNEIDENEDQNNEIELLEVDAQNLERGL